MNFRNLHLNNKENPWEKIHVSFQKDEAKNTTPSLFHYVHALLGKIALLPSSRQYVQDLDKRREKIELDKDWNYRRIAISVEGHLIDAVILGKGDLSTKERWVLHSDGQKGYYEGELYKGTEYKQILTELDAGGIVFNYPGVGHSSGMPNRNMMAKAYRALLNFLEAKDTGIGAKEIVLYGYSMGGGVQGDALLHHDFKEDIRYVLVKKQTFSNLSTCVASFVSRLSLGLDWLIDYLDWNMDSVPSSTRLQHIPEIILQTAKLDEDKDTIILQDNSLLIDDGIITKEASLAHALLSQGITTNKIFFGIREGHNEKLRDTRFLTEAIKQALIDQKWYPNNTCNP